MENHKPVVLELGGKSPNIVFEDADIEAAVQGALWGIFLNAGQICVAGSRLLVQRSIHDEFVEKLAQLAKALRLGPPVAARFRPMISEGHRQTVLEYIAKGKEEAQLVVGGGVPQDEELAAGYYVEPTIFCNVRPEAVIAQEEIFGPVLAVTPFDTKKGKRWPSPMGPNTDWPRASGRKPGPGPPCCGEAGGGPSVHRPYYGSIEMSAPRTRRAATASAKALTRCRLCAHEGGHGPARVRCGWTRSSASISVRRN